MKPETKTSTTVPTPNPLARRNFLLGATLAGTGAVAALVTGTPVVETADVLKGTGTAAKPKGYHVTPHIAQYYETTKL
ncbi:MAG: hypothetical protein ABL931_15505 [Usitatibacteraceae bacterium]